MSIANLLQSSNSKKPGSSQVTPTKGIAGLLAASNPSNGLAYVPRNTTQTPEKVSTLGKVGNFAKEIVKDPIKTLLVTPAARTTEAITRTVFPNSLAAKGYEAMSDAGESQNFKLPILGNIEVAPQKAFGQGGGEQIAGQALKSAAYLAPFALSARAAKQTALAAKEASTTRGMIQAAFTKGVKPVAPLTFKTLPTAGKVAAGFTEGAAFGAGGAMEEGASAGEVLKQGAIGGVLGAAIPTAIGAYGKFASKAAPKVAKVAAQDAAEAAAKSEVGYVVEKGKSVETPTLPGTATPETPPQATTPTISKVTPEIQAKAESIANKVREEKPDLNDFEHQQNIKQNAEILTEDRQSIFDVALGRKEAPGLIPATAYLRVAEDIADEAAKRGDLSLANELSKSNIGRKAGQSLQALAVAAKNSITGIIRDVRTTLEDALPTVIKKRKEAEVAKIQESITKIIDSFDGKVPTTKDISEALTELICK